MGLMFARRRQQDAKVFASAKAKAHAENHKKAHEKCGNEAVGHVVSKAAEAPKKAKDADKPGAK